MNINFNIPVALFKTLVEAVVQFSNDYHDLHASELAVIRENYPDYEPKVFYQDDRKAVEQELQEELERQARKMVSG